MRPLRLLALNVMAGLAILTAAGDARSGTQDEARSLVIRPKAGIEIAQSCGWYVVYMCSRNAQEAENWSYQREAINSFTIHTDPRQYPNFAPGWVCAVDGPMGKDAAFAKARLAKEYGTAPTAYARRSC